MNDLACNVCEISNHTGVVTKNGSAKKHIYRQKLPLGTCTDVKGRTVRL